MPWPFSGETPPLDRPIPSEPGEGRVWLHVACPRIRPAVRGLVAALSPDDDTLGVLVTDADPAGEADWPPFTRTEPAPGAPRALRRLVAAYRPDLLVWIGAGPEPGLVVAAARLDIALMLVMAEDDAPTRSGPLRSAATRRVLRRFDRILVDDRAAAVQLSRAGVEAPRITTVGAMHETALPLPHDSETHTELVARFADRPAWLAAALPETEERAVLSAHAAALRGAHRLLLILVPRDCASGEALDARLRAAGWNVARRADGDTVMEETQIFLADTDEELGLWYRLASIAYMGGTIAGDGGRSPFEPAALGAAILHGPLTGPHEARYERLHEVSGAIRVANPAALATALGELIAPDRAAALAHAAWDVTSAGAAATEAIREAILDMLGMDPEA